MAIQIRSIRNVVFGCFLWGAVGSLLVACGVDGATTPAPQMDPSMFYARMQLNHRAITLGSEPPYDTIQLIATPYAADGTPMITTSVAEFSMNDSSSIRVTPTGLVRAAATSGVADVFVSLTINGVAKRDTITVAIFPAPLPNIDTVRIVPPSDSTKRVVGGFYAVRTIATDSAGATITGVPARLWFPDTSALTFERRRSRILFGGLLGDKLGSEWLHSSATVFGRVFRDSLEWTSGQWLSGNFSFIQNMGPGPMLIISTNSVTIGVGGIVKWELAFADTLMDIVFDDPAGVSRDPVSADSIGGNIAPFRGGQIPGGWFPISVARSRRFSRPGVFRFHSTLHDIKGAVIVQDERKCLPNCPPFP